MKQMKRVAVVLCAAVITASASPVYATQVAKASFIATEEGALPLKAYNELSPEQQEQLRSNLRSLGLTEQDIAEIIQLERENYHPNRGTSFFRRPRVGEVRQRPYNVPTWVVKMVREAGKGALVKWLVSIGVPTIAAYAIVAPLPDIPANAKGLKIVVTETYGYTNDGVLGWNVGPVTFRFTY